MAVDLAEVVRGEGPDRDGGGAGHCVGLGEIDEAIDEPELTLGSDGAAKPVKPDWAAF